MQDYFGKRAGPFCIKVAAMLADRVKEPGASDPLFFRVDDHPGLLPGGAKFESGNSTDGPDAASE